MEKVISIGKQNFASLRENHYFFVDKSHFIKDWWENGDEITLITRPRRFGKTLNMSMYLARYYGRRVIILLDEYDTPMQEAYVHGYWAEFTTFVRSLFNATFKTNPYLERAVMTGITRVSKESIFSDLNNLRVVTTTSDLYADCFGFTEKEVFASLDEFGMGDKKDVVKQWYDGFIFGGHRDIYNPWSITNFLKEGQLRPYWASTSSNGLVNKMLQSASPEIKTGMETLLDGGTITVNFDEQIVFEQLEKDENAIWSLLLASGYLKVKKSGISWNYIRSMVSSFYYQSGNNWDVFQYV